MKHTVEAFISQEHPDGLPTLILHSDSPDVGELPGEGITAAEPELRRRLAAAGLDQSEIQELNERLDLPRNHPGRTLAVALSVTDEQIQRLRGR